MIIVDFVSVEWFYYNSLSAFPKQLGVLLAVATYTLCKFYVKDMNMLVIVFIHHMSGNSYVIIYAAYLVI